MSRTAEGYTLDERDGVWQVYFRVAGKRHRFSTYLRDRDRADEVAAASYLKALQDARVTVPSHISEGLPLVRIVALHLDDLQERLSSGRLVRGETYYLDRKGHLTRVLKRWSRIEDVTRRNWGDALEDWHAEGTGWRTLQQTTTETRQFLKWAEKRGYLQTLPLLETPTQEAANSEAVERQPMTAEQRDAFIAVASESPRRGRIYRVLFWSAARRSDLARLTRRQVDLERGYIRFPPIKTKSKKKGQDVWLHPQAAAALKEQIAENESGGTKMKPEDLIFGYFNFKRVFQALLKKAGITDVQGLTPHHVSRHTACTLAAEAGATPAELMALGRWTSLQMVQRYMKINAEKSKGALSRI